VWKISLIIPGKRPTIGYFLWSHGPCPGLACRAFFKNFLRRRKMKKKMNYHERAMKYLKKVGQRLLVITKDCRPDMHEPDEQKVSALIVGNHLDNAMGNDISVRMIEGGYQEYVVILKKAYPLVSTDKFNLATLISLARVGARSLLEEKNNEIKR